MFISDLGITDTPLFPFKMAGSSTLNFRENTESNLLETLAFQEENDEVDENLDLIEQQLQNELASSGNTLYSAETLRSFETISTKSLDAWAKNTVLAYTGCVFLDV